MEQEEVQKHLDRLEAIKERLAEERAADRQRAHEQQLNETAKFTGADPEGYAGVMLATHMQELFGDRAGESSYVEVLRGLTEAIIAGDESSIQRTLTVQMLVMNKAFMDMVNLMEHNPNLHNMKALGDLAAKFQNQSRRTAATLVDIKRPRQKTYIRQANVAENQQVNNGVCPNSSTEIFENELYEDSGNGQWLEQGEAPTAIAADPLGKTLGEIHGAQDTGREREVSLEQLENR